MNGQSSKKYIILFFCRQLICFAALSIIFNILGMAGSIIDVYADADVLSLVRESFWCSDGIQIAACLIFVLLLWDIVKVCQYFIKTYLLERPYLLGISRINIAAWMIIIPFVIIVSFQGWNIMHTYDRAVRCVEYYITLEDVNQMIEEKQTEILFVTRRGCPYCGDMKQSLLNILPKVDVTIVHYDTILDREKRAEEMYSTLNTLSVKSVPILLFIENGEVKNRLDATASDEALKDFLELKAE